MHKNWYKKRRHKYDTQKLTENYTNLRKLYNLWKTTGEEKIGRKCHIFPTPAVSGAAVGGDQVRISRRPLAWENMHSILPQNWLLSSCFHAISPRVTDRQMNRLFVTRKIRQSLKLSVLTSLSKGDEYPGLHSFIFYLFFSFMGHSMLLPLPFSQTGCPSYYTYTRAVQPCNPWPHVASRHISISQLLSLWRHSHCNVIGYWAGHAHRYRRTYGHLTAFNI